jgi:hypothetical protein
MPRSDHPSQYSIPRYSPTYHYPDRHLDLELCMEVLQQREDFATAINLLGNTRDGLNDIVFLDYLFQTIKQSERALENQKRFARDRISRMLAKRSSTQFYRWMVRNGTGIEIPLGSEHTPPDSSNDTLPPPSLQNTLLPIPPRRSPPFDTAEWTTPPRFPYREHESDFSQPFRSHENPIFIPESEEEFEQRPSLGTHENPIIISDSD